jgi:hypothetical protein
MNTDNNSIATGELLSETEALARLLGVRRPE